MLVVAELVGESKLVLLLGAVVLHMHAAVARLGLSQDQEARVPEVGARQPALRAKVQAPSGTAKAKP